MKRTKFTSIVSKQQQKQYKSNVRVLHWALPGQLLINLLAFILCINLISSPGGVALAETNDKNQSNLRTRPKKEENKWIEEPKFPKGYDEKTFVDVTSQAEELDLGNIDPAVAARNVMRKIGESIEERMTKIFEKAKSPECRAKIAEHFGYFLNSFGTESHFPFEKAKFKNTCPESKYDFDDLPDGVNIGTIQNRTYQPPRSEAVYIENAKDLKLCYGILTHSQPSSTIRLIESLYESGHTFVIHVDAKPSSAATYTSLLSYAQTHPHVHILPDSYRVRVNWGGFSMVNATLQLLSYAYAVSDPLRHPLNFHKFVHLASTSYPIASPTEIRRRIASYPLDANMMNVVFKPTNPHYMSWHYFVECDDAVHRIFRLKPLDETTHGVEIYTASQWFVISREFGRYLALMAPGSLARELRDYMEHVVVADESYFGTVLRHTAFCEKHHNDNFLHVQFDRWENELDMEEDRDERKCLMPDPDHCGRSPTTMTVDYLPILDLSNALFARKFIDDIDTDVKDIIDDKRAKDELRFQMEEKNETFNDPLQFDTTFEGHGVLIVARDTLYDDIPLCLGLGESKNKVRLTPCFIDGVRNTLAPEWETGAVVIDETLLHTRWEIGPCSTDGSLRRESNATMTITPGNYSITGPRCNIKQMDGIRKGRCMDAESDRVQPGGEVQVFPCVGRWHQLFSFGGGTKAPLGSIHTNIPLHVRNTIRRKGRDQEEFMCIGVLGRGHLDEEEWNEDEDEDEDEEEEEEEEEEEIEYKYEGNEEEQKHEQHERNETGEMEEYEELPPLSQWMDEQVVTTRCDNVDAIIEWVVIPFVHADNAQYEIIDVENSENASEVEEL